MSFVYVLLGGAALLGILLIGSGSATRGFGLTLLCQLPLLALMVLFFRLAAMPFFGIGIWVAVTCCVVLTMQFDGHWLEGIPLVLLLIGVFGGLALWEYRQEALLKQGTSALAKVLEVRDLNANVGLDPMIELRLQVLPAGGAPYEAETKLVVSRLTMAYYRPGITVNVKYDPKKPKRVVVESIQAGALP